eukprot:213305_1
MPPHKQLNICNLVKIVTVIFIAGIMCIILYIKDEPITNEHIYDSKKLYLSNTSQLHLHRSPKDPTDKYLYANRYTVNNTLCKTLFPPSIMLLNHHKTGTVLSRSIYNVITDYCDIYFENHDHKRYDNYIGYINFRDSHESLIKLQGTVHQNIRIHFWRDPVLTIVSGFAYHLSCTEHWASKKLSLQRLSIMAAFFEFNTDTHILFECFMNVTWTFDLNSEPPIWRTRLTSKQIAAMKLFNTKGNYHWSAIRQAYLYYLNDVVNQINLKNYGDFYGFDLDFDDQSIHEEYNIFRGDIQKKAANFDKYYSIKGWYSMEFISDNKRIKYGLFFEMIRYLFVVYPEIYY